MKLSQLLAGLPVSPPPPVDDPEVSGVAHDSRRVAPGDLFVAWRGDRFDGARFAAQAAERGAVAVLAQSPPSDPAATTVPWITAPDPHALLAPLAVRVYGRPHRELLLAGVTGTNGKSTVTALLASIFETAGRPCGQLGTIGYRFGDAVDESGNTTPEASDLFRLLRRMRDAGARAAAMEVSSHALALGRVDGLGFDLGVFTNLTQDHLDFHADLDDYYAAKRSLFDRLEPGGAAAINVDDRWGRRLAAELEPAGVHSVTFGERGDVRPDGVEVGEHETRGTLATPAGPLALVSPLLGPFNLSNLMAAVAGAVALRLPLDAIAAGIAALPRVPGRLEPLNYGQDFPVYIDYAHTPDALRAVLSALAELADRELIVVFGCGGDRDRTKRPIMGRIAGELAQRVILTSDNPRTEDPQRILDEVEAGLAASGNPSYEIIADRREAIRRALALAGPRSTVLVAGKGHETTQTIGTEEIWFSERDVIAQALGVSGPVAESTGALERG